jgi:hypothetical protein
VNPKIGLNGAAPENSFDVLLHWLLRENVPNIDFKATKLGMKSAFLGNQYEMVGNKILYH